MECIAFLALFGLDMPKITEKSILLPELQQCLSHLHLPIQKGERWLEKQ